MRKILIAVVIFLVIGIALPNLAETSHFVVNAQIPTPVKIMPLGDSITVGYPGTNGYRKNLNIGLTNSGFNVDFVGSQQNGTGGFDPDNEGHESYSANDIRDHVYSWLTSNPADVILLHIGTNDIQGGQDAAGVVAEVNSTLNNIDQWANDNGRTVTIILAQIILCSINASWNTTTKLYNDELQQMAEARSADHIIVVDMENALNYATDLSPDGIHPTDTGYAKMANVWYNALTGLLSYSLTINSVGQGIVNRIPNQTLYPYGTSVNLTALAGIGWTFSGWSGDLTGATNPASITMTKDMSVTASFIQNTYSVAVSVLPSSAAGNVTGYVTTPTYHYGDIVTLTEVPNSGYTFSGWEGDGSGSNTTCQINVTKNMSVTASFIQNTYSVAVSVLPSSAAGNVTGYVTTPTYHYGDIVTLTEVPNSGYSFSNWGQDGTGTQTTCTITVTRNMNVTAAFTPIYSLSVSNIGSGSVSKNPDQASYLYGDSVQLTAIPTNGWSFTGWSGSFTSSLNPINAIINETTSVVASFTQNSYTLSVATIGSGSVSKNPNQASYLYGDSVQLTAIPANGYSFSSWTATGSIFLTNTFSVSTSATISGQGTVTANFVQNPTNTPTPSPTATPQPTASPSPSPSINSPTPTYSAIPTSTPHNPNSVSFYLVFVVIAVILVGSIIGFLAFVKHKHSSRNNSIQN